MRFKGAVKCHACGTMHNITIHIHATAFSHKCACGQVVTAWKGEDGWWNTLTSTFNPGAGIMWKGRRDLDSLMPGIAFQEAI